MSMSNAVSEQLLFVSDNSILRPRSSRANLSSVYYIKAGDVGDGNERKENGYEEIHCEEKNNKDNSKKGRRKEKHSEKGRQEKISR